MSERVQRLWQFLGHHFLGRWLFTQILFFMIPYTGTLKAQVVELEHGRCKVKLWDKKSMRNHLNSIHAMALANLAEFSSGLALIYSLPHATQAILVAFEINYQKKARGSLMAEGQIQKLPPIHERINVEVPVQVVNDAGEVVCIAKSTWQVRPLPQRDAS